MAKRSGHKWFVKGRATQMLNTFLSVGWVVGPEVGLTGQKWGIVFGGPKNFYMFCWK